MSLTLGPVGSKGGSYQIIVWAHLSLVLEAEAGGSLHIGGQPGTPAWDTQALNQGRPGQGQERPARAHAALRVVSPQKAGGGLRQWKRVYATLRARSLCLSKERREPGPAAAGAAAAGAGEEEAAAPVCIGSCLVDISYSDTKRRHVLRLTTADFCEYLFQAEDRDDMLGWIRAIRENSRAEGEVSWAPGLRGAAGRGDPTFGCGADVAPSPSA